MLRYYMSTLSAFVHMLLTVLYVLSCSNTVVPVASTHTLIMNVFFHSYTLKRARRQWVVLSLLTFFSFTLSRLASPIVTAIFLPPAMHLAHIVEMEAKRVSTKRYTHLDPHSYTLIFFPKDSSHSYRSVCIIASGVDRSTLCTGFFVFRVRSFPR